MADKGCRAAVIWPGYSENGICKHEARIGALSGAAMARLRMARLRPRLPALRRLPFGSVRSSAPPRHAQQKEAAGSHGCAVAVPFLAVAPCSKRKETGLWTGRSGGCRLVLVLALAGSSFVSPRGLAPKAKTLLPCEP